MDILYESEYNFKYDIFKRNKKIKLNKKENLYNLYEIIEITHGIINTFSYMLCVYN